MKKHLLSVLLCGAVALSGWAKSKEKVEQGEFQHPVLTVPKLDIPPTLDGKIEPGEWNRAAAVTGVGSGGLLSFGKNGYSLVPEVQQVVWHIGFDDKYLYLAMRSKHKKGTYPYAKVKENDNMGVLFEDHVEIQILPHTKRELAGKAGKGFYKIMANPFGTFIDQHLYNGTVGTEEVWSTGGITKCHVAETYWDLEMSIELARLGKKGLDGKNMVIQLVRTDSCAGIYFAGLVPAPWMSWNKFAETEFRSKAPVFKFLKLGEIMAGKLNTLIEITGKDKPRDIEVKISVENAKGKTVYSEKKSVKVKPGETKQLCWQKDGIPVSDVSFDTLGKNYFEIKAVYKDGSKEQILYHNRTPFVKLTKEFMTKYIDPWLKGRPLGGDWNAVIAYLPYSGMAELNIDLDFFGMQKNILQAKKCKTEIRKKGDDNVIASSEFPIKELKGKSITKIRKLEAGDYEASFTLFDQNGKKIAEKIVFFENIKYPWDHNKLGKSGEVIPPYEPMKVKKDTISTWGADYVIGQNGLPQQIKVRMPTGNSGGITRKRKIYRKKFDLLASPIRLEVMSKGQLIKGNSTTGRINKEAMDRVDIIGKEQFGELTADVKAFEEYDNWYQVKLTLDPKKTVEVDSIDLVIDLKDMPVDTVYLQRERAGRSGNNYYAGIDRKPGIKFKSTQLLKLRMREIKKDWKSFVPQAYVGNGDCGLWFFAWTDLGWVLKDNDSAYQIERLKNGNVRVRVRLIAGPLKLDKKRSLEFALQAVPVKPNAARYRTCIGEDWVFHDTTGYRFYGRSVDSFDTHSKDREALRKYLLYGNRYNKKPTTWVNRHWNKKVKDLNHLSLYGSTIKCGTGAPEFRTFGGEWLMDSNWQPKPDTAYTDKWNYEKTVRWGESPQQMNVKFINWTKSFTDFFVWYYDKLIDECGVNGTWWDDQQIMIIHEYNIKTGKMEEKFSTLARRKLCKRLNVVGWKHMRPPTWILNMQTDFPWCQLFWMVESSWYCEGENTTAPMHFSSIDVFRAMTRTKSTMMPVKAWLSGYEGTTPEMDHKVKRSLVAMLASHDIFRGKMSANTEEGNFLRRMSMFVNLPDTSQCLFTGYWRTQNLVQPSGKEIVASVFTNNKFKTVAILFYNLKKKDQFLAGTTIDPSKIPGFSGTAKVKRVFDVETGKDINTVFENGKIKISEQAFIPWHDYRVIGVEVE